MYKKAPKFLAGFIKKIYQLITIPLNSVIQAGNPFLKKRYFMWYVYVLESQRDGNHYTGMSTDVKRRLKQHNSGKVRSTKSRRPFKIIYKEPVGTRKEARKREKYLKSAAGRRFLKEYLSRGSLPE
jgi:putative endonuclease